MAEGQVDLLCDHINEFVQGGLKDLIRRYEIAPLRIFEEEVSDAAALLCLLPVADREEVH